MLYYKARCKMLKKSSIAIISFLLITKISYADIQPDLSIEKINKIIESKKIVTKNIECNIEKLITSVQDRCKAMDKGEFEKEEDYKNRLISDKKEIEELQGKFYFSTIDGESISSAYNTEKETLCISIMYKRKKYPFKKPSLENMNTYYLVSITTSQNTKQSSFQNAYGAKIDGWSINEIDNGIFFKDLLPSMNSEGFFKRSLNSFANPGVTTLKGKIEVEFQIKPEIAKENKKSIKAGVFYSVIYAETSNITEYGSYTKATISHPIERYLENKSVATKIQGFVVYNSMTGEILYSINKNSI